MKALVFGSTGQVAQELRLRLPGAVFLSRAEADLRTPETCAAAIAASDAEVVINAAAFTAVDQAESDEATARLVNGTAPGVMARAAAARGIPFLHVSTDYVFDGTGTAPWQPDDETGPLGAYGRSKLAGEHGVHAAGGRFVILRTSWVFSAHGTNFVKTMLRLGKTRAALAVVADQVGGPTAAGDIASALIEMGRLLSLGLGAPGTYHFAGAPDVSWAGFAREIFHQAGLQTQVTDIPAAAYPTPARRPQNSRLDCSTTETVFGVPRPDWRKSLTKVLKDLGEI
ncbi:MAG: dTDP-4-dehydrorhamnose reductase [Cereibacter sp.]